ncbi:MAG TPA: helix-hairpin-helix domain-containing protein [Saprospiraceae bacterium]|nr:helix-hairpin-helix domain-containing protein [Saprospiraceae bacterium]HMQ82217.1 helix-hairpin-helix domain-containing protein [Saprospiraceae bacterium]
MKAFFYYTRAERRGALMLIALSLLAFLLPAAYPLFFRQEQEDFTELERELDSLYQNTASASTDSSLAKPFHFDPNTIGMDSLMLLGLSTKVAANWINYREKIGYFKSVDDLKKLYTLSESDFERLSPYAQINPRSRVHQSSRVEQKTRTLFEFDPNTASREELLLLGFSEKTADNLLKYRSKGGRFVQKEDVKRVYGLSTDLYRELAPYIQIKTIAATEQNADKPEQVAIPKSYEDYAPIKIDINHASSVEWEKLRGIGAVLSKRIIHFREKLGGFTSVEQVAETYGLPDSTFQRIKPQLSPSPIFRKIAINQAGVEVLKEHPYLSMRVAKAIVSYREMHGNFANLEALRKVQVLDAATLEKLTPYLDFD